MCSYVVAVVGRGGGRKRGRGQEPSGKAWNKQLVFMTEM